MKTAAADSRFESFRKNASNEEKTIDAYCGRGSQINYDIRDNTVSEAGKAFIENMDKALDGLPVYKGQTYRGINDNDGSIYKSAADNIGGTIEWKGYTSTTRDETRADTFGKLKFTILSLNGRDVEEYSSIKSEKEVVFKRGTKFKIISAKDNHVILEEL